MSGEPVTFVVSDESAFAVRAIQVLAELPVDLPPWALIGGLAVSVTLAGPHRATADIDAVSLDKDTTVAVLLDRGADRSGNGVRILIDRQPIELDLIDVAEGDPQHGGFLAHRLALDTAERRAISVVGRTGTALAGAIVSVATAEALVAMKVHAVGERRASRPEKRSGDVYDIVRLVKANGPAPLARRLADVASPRLVAEVRRLILDLFEQEATRTRRWVLVGDRGSHADEVTREDIALVAEMASHISSTTGR